LILPLLITLMATLPLLSALPLLLMQHAAFRARDAAVAARCRFSILPLL